MIDADRASRARPLPSHPFSRPATERNGVPIARWPYAVSLSRRCRLRFSMRAATPSVISWKARKACPRPESSAGSRSSSKPTGSKRSPSSGWWPRQASARVPFSGRSSAAGAIRRWPLPDGSPQARERDPSVRRSRRERDRRGIQEQFCESEPLCQRLSRHLWRTAFRDPFANAPIAPRLARPSAGLQEPRSRQFYGLAENPGFQPFPDRRR